MLLLEKMACKIPWHFFIKIFSIFRSKTNDIKFFFSIQSHQKILPHSAYRRYTPKPDNTILKITLNKLRAPLCLRAFVANIIVAKELKYIYPPIFPRLMTSTSFSRP